MRLSSLLIIALILACSPKIDPNIRVRAMTDKRDGLDYPTMGVAGKLWLAYNAGYKTPGSWCYNDDPNECATYGRLYSYQDASTRACPNGWHLPGAAEWVDLIEAVGGYFDLPSKTTIGDPNASYAALTTGSFNATLGGSRTPDGTFIDRASLTGDGDGMYWSSSSCGAGVCVSFFVINAHSKRILRV
jgi:uncharacterized protein (TIGR02145 family)